MAPPRFKTNLLEHLKAVATWARRRGARSAVEVADMTLAVQSGERALKLFPQFVGKRDGKQLAYFDIADQYAIGFVGWLPYKVQAWDVSLSKLAFKAAARELGLTTPALWRELGAVDAPFLIKRDRGAFGYGLRGPYAAADAARLELNDGEYCEAFKWGRIARAWYWAGEIAVLEAFAMPSVTGDGRTRVDALLRQSEDEPPPDLEPLLRLQGLTLGSIAERGKRIVCDYRYVSPFNPTLYANHNLLPRLAGSALVQRFAEAGRRLWPRIPGAPQRQLGFVLDAIVDADDVPWFLEVNSNPQLHPDVYAPMLDGLYGLRN